ncbi:MAG: hypothetical protein IT454_15295 [Planctomycetes bacterium]|nr:hypothetical protein [Planctomycetota bacterium]
MTPVRTMTNPAPHAVPTARNPAPNHPAPNHPAPNHPAPNNPALTKQTPKSPPQNKPDRPTTR